MPLSGAVGPDLSMWQRELQAFEEFLRVPWSVRFAKLEVDTVSRALQKISPPRRILNPGTARVAVSSFEFRSTKLGREYRQMMLS